jgi:hypothetical protein
VSLQGENALRVYWVASLCTLALGIGIAVGMYGLFPYRQLLQVSAKAQDLMRHPRHALRLSPQKFLADSPPPGRGVTRNIAGKASPGVTLVTGFFEGAHGLRLLALDGRVLNEWRLSYNEIWPKSPHLDSQPHDWDTLLHGAMLTRNGDVIVTFQYAGLARLDPCGRVRWKLSRQTHHMFSADADGNIWVPSRRERDAPLSKFASVPPPFQEEYVLKVSPEGEVLDELSILDAIFDSRLEGLLFANGDHDTEIRVPLDGDFTHLNDVEVLSPGLAQAFPMFEAGDLLLSLRNLNLLLVVDPRIRRIKWTSMGLSLRQHDPDFLPTGRIAVFDNRRDSGNTNRFGGSRILALDPATGAYEVLYGDRAGERFYSDMMGAQQLLRNGNLLISESKRGHAFEVDPAGNVVWEFVNRWKSGEVGKVAQATRYPESYVEQSTKESCHET